MKTTDAVLRVVTRRATAQAARNRLQQHGLLASATPPSPPPPPPLAPLDQKIQRAIDGLKEGAILALQRTVQISTRSGDTLVCMPETTATALEAIALAASIEWLSNPLTLAAFPVLNRTVVLRVPDPDIPMPVVGVCVTPPTPPTPTHAVGSTDALRKIATMRAWIEACQSHGDVRGVRAWQATLDCALGTLKRQHE